MRGEKEREKGERSGAEKQITVAYSIKLFVRDAVMTTIDHNKRQVFPMAVINMSIKRTVVIHRHPPRNFIMNKREKETRTSASSCSG